MSELRIECTPGGCQCACHRPGGMNVAHIVPCCAPDHPHTDPGDGRTECDVCGKWVHECIHSCKGVPVTPAAWVRWHKRTGQLTPLEDFARELGIDLT